MATMASFKLYGVPMSQPFRSVAWTLLMCNAPFEIQIAVPGATSRVGTRNDAHLSKTRFRHDKVPLLEHGKLVVAESPAIMMYICELCKRPDLYGPLGSERKATIDSYLHWHHSGTRNLGRLSVPHLRPERNFTMRERDHKLVDSALDSLENGWLSGQDFIAGGDQASIADILAFEEVIQLPMLNLRDLNGYQNIQAWMQRMRILPFYEAVHVPLQVVGDLTTPSDVPIMKRLAAATKEGIKALNMAQLDSTEAKL